MFNKRYGLMIFWIASIFYLETVLRYVTGGRFFAPALLYSFLFGTTIALVITGMLTSIRHPRVKNFLNALFIFLMGAVFASQFVYFQLMRTFYTVYSAGNAGRILEFANLVLLGVLNNWFFVLMMFLPFVIALIQLKFHRGTLEKRKNRVIWLFGAAIMIHFGSLGLIQMGDHSVNSPYNLYYNMHYPEFSVNNLGVLTYMRIDAKRSFIGWDPEFENPVSIVATTETTVEIGTATTEESATTSEPTTEPASATEPEPEPPIPPVYNVMAIDFNTLIANETDAELLELHRYFQAVEPTTQNIYTGKYKGYNLIFITAEGFSHLAIRPDITPTLYKMTHEGFYFTNFYTPPWGVSTSDGEYVATTGLIPKSGVWSYRYSSHNAMPFAMGNQLKALGYLTKAYHNHTYTYYDRHLSHPNMGYDYKGVGNGLVITKSWPESDLEMMAVTLPEYVDVDLFHTYYMTVSGHMLYDFENNQMAFKNRSVVKNLPYSEHVKAYLATQVEFDRAMAYLLEQLELSGKLDNTVIAISADHYPYGLTQSEIEELAGGEVETNFELYRNAFILYVHGMRPEVIDKPASSLDILPTLSNLLGLTYDSRLLMGRDIFSDAPPLVIFNNHSYISEYGRYNTVTGEFSPSDLSSSDLSKTMDDETLKTIREQIAAQINAKFYYSAKVLEKNYYAEVR